MLLFIITLFFCLLVRQALSKALCTGLFINSFDYIFVHAYLYVFIYLLTYLSIGLFTHVLSYLFVYICLLIYMICLLISLFTHLTVYLYMVVLSFGLKLFLNVRLASSPIPFYFISALPHLFLTFHSIPSLCALSASSLPILSHPMPFPVLPSPYHPLLFLSLS